MKKNCLAQLRNTSLQYRDCLKQLNETEMDLTREDIEKTLAPIKDDFKTKALNVQNFIQSLENHMVMIKTEEDRLKKKRNMIKNKINSIKDYLLFNMQQTGITKIESDLFKITIKKNPPSVDIINEGEIPTIFLRIKTEPDKESMKKFLQEKGDQAWARLIQEERISIT